MTVEVKCKGHMTLPIDRILEFQGKLKKLSEQNRKKLVSSITKLGFIAPLFVWDCDGEYKLLDGHQRLSALLWMRENGWDIPMLPIDIIEADNEEDAKIKLLHITSQYGEFDIGGYIVFTENIEVDDTIRLTDSEWQDIDKTESQENKENDNQSIEYKEKNEIIIECENEKEAEDIYTEMIERGMKCKLSTL